MFFIEDGFLVVKATSVSKSWSTALQAVFFEGKKIQTQYDKPGDLPSRDVTSAICITRPFSEPFTVRGKPRKIDGYDVFFHPSDVYCMESIKGGYLREVMTGERDKEIWKSGTSYPYTYHDRLYNYKAFNMEDAREFKEKLENDRFKDEHDWMEIMIKHEQDLIANFPSIDQIEQITKKLANSRYTRRAQGVTWRPAGDNVRDDPPCYDDQTEILTKEGWKLFKDLVDSDEVMTLNPENNEMIYQKPVKRISYNYKGNLHLFDGQNCNFSVTPNHSMLIYHRRSGNPFLVTAEALPHEFYIKRSGIWSGQRVDEFDLDGHKIPMAKWLEFLAIYLSDGSYTVEPKDSRYRIRITQKKNIKKYREIIAGIAEILDFKVHEIDDSHCPGTIQFTFHSKVINDYVSQFRRSKDHERYIPTLIKSLTSSQIKLFLDAFQLGDSTNRSKTVRYNSTSKKLIDDLQELVLKSGKDTGADIWERKDVKYYELKESHKKRGIFVNRKNVELIDYDGEVFCVEVPLYNVIYVRRKGKPMWCGNCLQRVWARIFKGEDGIERLRFNTHWRSRDLFGAWEANVNGMLQIARKMCDDLGVEMGSYLDFCDSLHTYGRKKLVYKEIIPLLERVANIEGGLIKPEYNTILSEMVEPGKNVLVDDDGA